MKQLDVKVSSRLGYKRTYKGEIPETWSELSASQLIAVAEFYLHDAIQVSMIANLVNIPTRLVKKMTEWEIYNILQDLKWMGDFQPLSSLIIVNVNKLYPPRPKLENMNWGQFIYVDTFYDQYVWDQTNESLDIFIAHLYLPNNEEFDHTVCSSRALAPRVKSVDKQIKLAIMINYRLVREWLMTVYPLVFVKKNKAESPDKAEIREENKKSQLDWIKIHEAIVGDNLVDYEKYATLNVHTIFRYLTRKIKENARKKH